MLADGRDPKFWRAENGAIIGESTAQNRVSENSFLIWRGGTVRDFELKIEFRINGTNSGVQYRSKERPDVGKWVLQRLPGRHGLQQSVHRERPRRARPAFLSF